MPQLIDVPGMGVVEFPDGMSDDQISSAIQKNMAPQKPTNPFMIKDSAATAEKASKTMQDTFNFTGAGIKQGASDLGDMGNKAWLNVAKHLNVDSNLPVKYDDYTGISNAEKANFDASPAGQNSLGQGARFITNTAPYALVPGGVAGGLLTRTLTGGLANAAIGNINDLAEDNSFPINTLLGGAIGAAAPPVLAAGKLAMTPVKTAYDYFFPKGKILSDTAKTIGDDLPNVIKTKQAGERIGVQLTPAEASGNPLLAQMQGRAGTTEEGAQAMYRFGQEHVRQQQAAVSGLIDDISPNASSGGANIRRAAQAEIAVQKKALGEKAAPIYDEAYKSEIPQQELDELLKNKRVQLAFNDVLNDPDYAQVLGGKRLNGKEMIGMWQNRIDNLLKEAVKKPYNGTRIEQLNFVKKNLTTKFDDPRVQDILKEIKAEDPVFHAVTQGINPRSIQVLDLVKRRLGEVSAGLKGNEKAAYKASLVTGTTKDLLKKVDAYSPAYGEARALFGEGAKPLQTLNESTLGRIAELPDQQLKNVSKIIFDPAQTDRHAMATLRVKIGKKNPGAWNQIVRNEMERRLDKTAGEGTNFYNKILKGQRDFNQFLTATKNIPGAQKKLIDMRAAFKNIINPTTSRTSAALAKSSLDVPRSSMQFISDIASNVMGGRYDKAFVEFITNPKWDQELAEFAKKGTKNVYETAIKYGSVLSKIAAGKTNLQENPSPLSE